MNFTTITKIAREGSKIFDKYNEAIVLSNNKPIWAVLNYKIYEQLKKRWYLDKIIFTNDENFLDEEKNEYLKLLEYNMKEWKNDEHDNLFA
jgi:hypothetical protein